MVNVKVSASTDYEILIGDGLLDRCGELIKNVSSAKKICIVSDDTVAALYLSRVELSLSSCGFETVSFVFPHGEASKNMHTLTELLEFAAQSRLTRTDCFVALGGGVVGDLCGFASAVYLRGVRFVQIPTTLLAAVDSSVGGKTGVDLAAGKNLAGAFHQPSLVICDYSTLDTLPAEYFADGCAEVVKYGVIGDREFFDSLALCGVKPQMENVIARSVMAKRDIVEEDEFDTGKRQLLNLGHTIGHAVELCSELNISHGSAVAIGMTVVMRAAVRKGFCKAEELDMLVSLLGALKLPTECPYSASQLYEAATADKKRMGDFITLVVPYSIGDTRLMRLPISELCDFIAKGL